MPTFVHPALLWGLLLAGVPVLIHLINMRHRRVQWAAMEFLLVSQKKNRTWFCSQLLLLLPHSRHCPIGSGGGPAAVTQPVGQSLRRQEDPPSCCWTTVDVRPLGRHRRLTEAKAVAGRIGKRPPGKFRSRSRSCGTGRAAFRGDGTRLWKSRSAANSQPLQTAARQTQSLPDGGRSSGGPRGDCNWPATETANTTSSDPDFRDRD